MSRKVIYAKVHLEVFIPEIGTLGSVLPPQNKVLPSLEMYYDGNEGLLITCKTKAGKTVSAIIPPSSVALLQVEPTKEIKPKS